MHQDYDWVCPLCDKQVLAGEDHAHPVESNTSPWRSMFGVGDNRINRDELFLRIAELFAQRGTCVRAKVGAVAVQENRIVSSGYVGAVAGEPHCIDVGCLIGSDGGCTRTVHAEANVIAWAARSGVSLEGASMYSTYSPCLACAKLVINAGFSKYVYRSMYRDPSGFYLLNSAQVKAVMVVDSESASETALD